MAFSRLLFASLISLSLSACVMKSQHDQLLATQVRTANDLTATTKERDELRAQNKDLQRRLSDVDSRNEELSTMNQVLAGKNSDWSKRCQQAQEELLRIKQDLSKPTPTPVPVESHYDDLIRVLKSEIGDTYALVLDQGTQTTVRLSNSLLFVGGTDQLTKEGQNALGRLAGVFRKVKDRQIEIGGHTDNVEVGGSLAKRFPTNWELSAARAVTALRYLEKKGVPPKRMLAAGYGEYQPVAENNGAEGRERNRRIEIVLVPVASESTSN